MTVKNVSNLAASVQARRQNHARATMRPLQELLQYYAMERLEDEMAPEEGFEPPTRRLTAACSAD